MHYRPGRANSDADALSRNAICNSCDNYDIPWKVLAVDDQPAKEGEESLSERQMADPAVAEIIPFLEDGITPENDHKAREVTLTMTQYEVMDGISHHIELNKAL